MAKNAELYCIRRPTCWDRLQQSVVDLMPFVDAHVEPEYEFEYEFGSLQHSKSKVVQV